MLGGVRGQPGGGRRTYFSVSGSVDWQKACLMSPDRSGRLWQMASEVSRQSSGRLSTGAKQSLVDHSCGSKLPRATILHFARLGRPFSSYLTVDMAMVGRALPTVGRNF